MSVLCALPVQVPVHRVRATVRCRDLGSALHRTVRLMIERAGAGEELIAAATGVKLARVAQVRGELERELAPIEREYLLWVDHARRRCLPYSALDGVVTRWRAGAGLLLPFDPPTPVSLAGAGLDVAASWDGGVDGHVEIDRVIEVVSDVRGAEPNGRGRLSHVLQLPDVQLLVACDRTSGELRTALAQHGQEDGQLTDWMHEHFGPLLSADILDLADVSPHAPPPRWLADLTGEARAPSPDRIGGSLWRAVEPSPAALREAALEVADAARDRLSICARGLPGLPEWLGGAVDEALARGVSVVAHQAASDADTAKGCERGRALADMPDALCLIADGAHAAIHTDPRSCLELGAPRRPVRQHVRVTDERAAVRELLSLLDLELPVRRRGLDGGAGATVARLLEQALADLRDQLPHEVETSIRPQDRDAAEQLLARYGASPDDRRSPLRARMAVAAGVAWESVVIATVCHLCDGEDRLRLLAERWSPPQGAIDLDVILADHAKRIVWVIDAKNSAPANRHLGTMIHQLRVLADARALLPDGWRAVGLMVHQAKQLPGPPRQTEYASILRASLADLKALLLAEQLPEQRV